MKTRKFADVLFCPCVSLPLWALLCLAAVRPAFGQAVSTPTPEPAALVRFDLNRNGVLDPAERAAWEAQRDKAVPTTAVAAPAAPGGDEVIQLSPFQVDTSRDNGYYAANTLSGTRINSRVQDLGGSITVITRQQLEDTASIDINDIFRYEANTEGIFNFTAQNSASPTVDVIQSNPSTSTRIRGISAPKVTLDYFTHTSRIPIDTYNIGSAEITRGPNSTLAGLGSPSGTINTNRDPANLSRATNQVGFRVDNLGSYRSSFNLNRPLLQDKLALRVAGLYANNEYRQKPSYDVSRRLYAAVTAKPFANTTLRGRAEVVRNRRQAPNSLTPRDGVSEWVAAGRPTWNPLTFSPTVNGVARAPIPVGTGNTAELLLLPNGLFVNATTYTRPSMYLDNGQVQFWSINRLGMNANPNAGTTSNVRMLASGSAYQRGTVNAGTLYQVPGVSDQSIYDWTKINAVSTNWSTDQATLYTAELQQKIIDTLYFRAAWHLEDSEYYNRNISNPPSLHVDVNEFLLNGQRNPNFLRPYIYNIEPTIFRSPEYNDAVQAQLTYDLDLRRGQGWKGWLGRHQFVANWENRKVTNGTFRYREAILDTNHAWMTPGALNLTNGPSINRPTYVYYVGPSGATGFTPGYTPPKSGVEGNYNFNWYNATTSQWVSEPAQFGTTTYLSSQSRAETTTRSVSWQGNLLKDRVVVTGGLREDDYRTRNSNTSGVDGITGQYTYDALKIWGPWTEADGPSKMLSVVGYPFKSRSLGLTYSRSDSFQPQPQAVDLFGTTLGNTSGRGRDIGIFANLFNDKLVVSFKVYKVNVKDDRTANSTLGSRIARLEAGTYLPGTGSDRMSLYNFAQTQARARLGEAATQAQVDVESAKITQFPAGFQNALAANIAGAAIRGTADTAAKGAEMEVTYNPTYNWNLKFTGAQTEAMNERIESNLADYIEERMPYWTSLRDAQGDLWWTSTVLNAQSAKAYYDSAVLIPLKVGQALLGKSNLQVKKYSWRLLSTYRFTRGVLKDSSVGGSARWDDRSVIGYLAGAADSDGVVRTLDVNRGIYDPARYQFDFWVSHTRRFYKDKIRARFQLNLNNAFEGGGLRVTAVNPDGQPYNFRIINPRALLFTTTFDF